MEAATPLRTPRVAVFGDVVVADALAVRDRVAVELVRERSEAGADPAEVLVDAIEIGARVLSREQAEVNADFVRTEFEKVSREVEGAFTEKARTVAELLGKRVDDVFGPENGHLAKELERLFGAESAVAVQHQLRAVMAEQSARMREDLLKQFSSADAHNPLADFKAGTMAAMRRAADQQDTNLKALNEQIGALRSEVAKLQAEREKAQEVAAEHARSTAKGRPYEEAVFDAVDAIARARGDDADAVGDLPGGGGRKGDVLVGVDGCAGPPRARIVFEAKNAYVPKNKRGRRARRRDGAARRRLRRLGRPVRGAAARPRRAAARGQRRQAVRRLRPRRRPRLGLEVAYALARARMLMVAGGRRRARRRRTADRGRARAGRDGRRAPDQDAAHGAAGGIEAARKILDDMAERVRGHLVPGRRARRGRHGRHVAAAGPPRPGVSSASAARRAPGLAQLDRGAGAQHRAGVDPGGQRDQERRRGRA